MTSSEDKEPSGRQKALNLALAALTAQVGCLTLFFVLAAAFGGLWLDNYFQTKPWFTIGLLIASIPLSLFGMFFIARKAVNKIKANSTNNSSKEPEKHT